MLSSYTDLCLLTTLADIVGCELDRSSDQISFYLNGQPMGVAFTKIGDDIKLFPAVRHTLLSHYDVSVWRVARGVVTDPEASGWYGRAVWMRLNGVA